MWDGCDGYLERKGEGRFEGLISVEGIDLSPIEGVYFTDDKDRQYLWMKRKPLLEFDHDSMSYVPRSRQPMFEVYLEKCMKSKVNYYGTFTFMRFRFAISGIWDNVMGKDKYRLNLYVQRLPEHEQTIINMVNEKKKTRG